MESQAGADAADERSGQGSLTLAKGLNVLRAIANADSPLRFMDLKRTTGLPKGTLHRMLSTLIDAGMIRVNGSDLTYRVGAQLITMAQRAWSDYELTDVAKPEMARLQDLTGDTVTLGMLNDLEVVHIDQLSSRQYIGVQRSLGRRDPVHCSAIGKAILAFLPAEDRDRLVARLPLTAMTPNSIADADALMRELVMIRARGYALEDEELFPSVRAVAAPVLDHTGTAIAAIGLAGPTLHLSQDRLHELGPDLIEATRRASVSAGGAPLPTATDPRPQLAVRPDLAPLPGPTSLLGESPLWDAATGTLYWVDIYAPAIHAFRPADGSQRTLPQRQITSALTLAPGGLLLAARHSGPVTIAPEDGSVVAPVGDGGYLDPAFRFNDAKVDSRGRLWAGYMPFRPRKAEAMLLRIAASGEVVKMETGLTLPNGIAWSLDDRFMYLADTAAKTIFRYSFAADAGSIGNRTALIRFGAGDSLAAPNGLLVDAEDHLWVAMWDGWCLKRFDPEGRETGTLVLPVPRPTSMAFGGPDLRTLFITSARIRLSSESLKDAPLSGSVFAVRLPVGGTPGPAFGVAGPAATAG